MGKGQISLTLLATCLVLIALFPSSSSTATLHFFYAENCSSCQQAKPFIAALRKNYPQLDIQIYDVWMQKDNYELMQSLAETSGSELASTPTTAIGQRVWYGFNSVLASEIEKAVQDCLADECTDLVTGLNTGNTPAPPVSPSEKPPNTANLPIDPQQYSLPAFTIVLGLLDSINPCAFFVLLFLLSLMIHTHSRKKMFLIGGIFIFFSGLLYFLFMAAWLNLFLLAGQLPLLTMIAGLVALTIASLNIKDHFYPKQGPSLSIADTSKPRLAARMRNLLKSDRLWPLMIGTAVLALVANSYELLCTAGFPMVYTRVLTMRELADWQYYLYLGGYNLAYITPLLAIVIVFSLTFGSHKLSEFEGRTLKLISGMLMLPMGLILLFRPILLQNLFVVVGLLAGALLVTGGIVLLEKSLSTKRERH